MDVSLFFVVDSAGLHQFIYSSRHSRKGTQRFTHIHNCTFLSYSNWAQVFPLHRMYTISKYFKFYRNNCGAHIFDTRASGGAKVLLVQSRDMTWKPLSSLPSSGSCSAGRLGLPLLSLSLQVRWLPGGGGWWWGGGVLGAGAVEPAELELKVWIEVEVGAKGADEGTLDGRRMGGLLCLLRMPMREDFFWACSACCCCWFSTCWFRISWTSSCQRSREFHVGFNVEDSAPTSGTRTEVNTHPNFLWVAGLKQKVFSF